MLGYLVVQHVCGMEFEPGGRAIMVYRRLRGSREVACEHIQKNPFRCRQRQLFDVDGKHQHRLLPIVNRVEKLPSEKINSTHRVMCHFVVTWNRFRDGECM